MAIINKGVTFTSGAVTPTQLNNLVANATFVDGPSGTTDDTTLEVSGTGQLQVKESGVDTQHIADAAITSDKIADGSVTPDKLSGTGYAFGDGTLELDFSDSDTGIFSTTTQTSTSRYSGSLATVYGASGNPNHHMRRARGTEASPADIQSGDVLGSITWTGYRNSGSAWDTRSDNNAEIRAIATQNAALNQEGTTLVFLATRNNDNAPLEMMRFSPTGGILVGTTTDEPSAILTLNENITSGAARKGFLPPKMTEVQRDGISSPAAGLTVYNTTTNKMNFYNGTFWEQITSA